MPPPTYIRPVPVGDSSPFLGDTCALCKEAYVEGDHLVICPQDGSRHHQACWEANGNRCTAYGCEGYGEISLERRRSATTPFDTDREARRRVGGRSKVRTLPSSNIGCAQTCLVISIAIAIVLIAAGCFGLWAVADYILIEVLGWQYRAPFTGSILGPSVMAAAYPAFHLLLL